MIQYLKSILFILTVFSVTTVYSQSMREGKCNRKGVSICPSHTFFHETNTNLKGYSFNSINVDKNLYCGSKNLLSLRLGFLYMSWKKVRSIGVPVELCLMFGSGASMLEIAAGYQYQYFYKNYAKDSLQTQIDNASYQAITGRIGYRYEKPKGGIFFRFGFTPLYAIGDYSSTIPFLGTSPFIPMAGGAIGWTFRKWPRSREE